MRTLVRLLGYLGPHAGGLVLGALCLALGSGMLAAGVATIKPLVNEVLRSAGAGPQELAPPVGGPDILQSARDWLPARGTFVQVSLLLVVLFFVRGVTLYLGQYLTIRAGASVIRDLRAQLFESVTHQSPGFFQTHPTGTILSRVLSDVMLLQNVMTIQFAVLVRAAAMIPFLLATAIYHEWRLALVALVAVPLLGYPMVRLGQRLRRASTASQEHLALVANRLGEVVGGVRVVQSFGAEAFEVSRFRQALDHLLRASLRAARAQSLSPAVIEFLGASIGAALFALAGVQIARGGIDPGNFAVVLFCTAFLFTATRRLNLLYGQIQQALAAGVRVFEMLDREREIRELPGAVALARFRESIRFEQVSFSYGDETVLRRIDLTIPRGEVVALVGPSGSGKSTLANLLPRFYDPTAGRICIDGTDIRQVGLASLREQIGVVTQETVLFDDTVRNNIAYARPDVPLERVVAAARAACAHEFVERLPEGYDTRLGERGARLSMGQRQRLTIARALLKSPPILILDEATSALDAESEALVQRALEALMRGRTSIVIAHRLATVRRADRILVLEAGTIVEQGTHQVLLARGGAYAHLHALQFAGS